MGGTCNFVFILRYADPLLISVVLLLTPVAALIEGIGLGLSRLGLGLGLGSLGLG